MIQCPVCHESINNYLLRAEFPKCQNGHDIGHWVSCSNPGEEKHVYLEYEGATCPYCASAGASGVSEGAKVKCLFVNAAGGACTTRPFLWIQEGPPCFMNHVGKMRLQ